MSGQLKEFKSPNIEKDETFPSFLVAPNHEDVQEGERLEISCIIQGKPTPKVMWRKGLWLEIDDGGRYEVKRDLKTGCCSMVIKNSRTSDIANYKVVATNDFGEVTCPFTIKVLAKGKKRQDSRIENFKSHLKHREVKQVEKKTPEEREKEVLEILKNANPKDYERICIEYGFYDFRMILRKLQALQPREEATSEFEAVKVLKGLRHVTVNDEGTAVFEIQIENVNPDKHIMWYKDGELLNIPSSENRHELRKIGNVYQLIIRNVVPEDAGIYTLDIGGHRFDAILTIKEQPIAFDTNLKPQKAKVKGRCIFECVLSKTGQKVAWFKDSKIITTRATSRIQTVVKEKSHKLIITEIEMKDAGLYTAQVGDIESSAELTVQAASVRFRHRLANTEVKEKSSTTFECSVNSKEIIPIWTVNGVEVQNAGRYLIKSGDMHSLTIKRIALTDDKAEVKVRFGEVTSSATLHVTAKPIKVTSKMKNTKCDKGRTAVFSCAIDDPDVDATVEWFKDGKPINVNSGKYEISKNKGSYSLKVNNVQTEDEGSYQFQVRGVRTEGRLYCSDPPVVDKSFIEKLKKNPLRFKAGAKAKIDIPFSGKIPQSISWTNGRVTLENRGRFHFQNDSEVVTLTVDNCQVTDAGMYELTISNENGEVTIEIPVKILDKPSPPSGEIIVSDVGKDFAEFSWSPPTENNIPVDNYIIEAKDKTGKWKEIAKVPGNAISYKATALKEGEEYLFRVKSSNEEGESEALESKPISVLAPDEIPSTDPKVMQDLENNPIIVRAGETATIKIPCKGNPPPSARWIHNGEEIVLYKHHRACKMSTNSDVALTITDCRTSDSGDYEAQIFNSVGSIVLKTKILVKDVADFANAQIKIEKVTPTEVSMSWKGPVDDGGSPITAYIVERSLAGKNVWEKVGKIDDANTNFNCKGCKPEEKYVFRVKAVNEQGISEPAVSTAVTCAPEIVPPSIDEESFKKLTEYPLRVKVGQTTRLVVPLEGGQPPPTITWVKENQLLEEDGKRVMINNRNPKRAQLVLQECLKSDSGRYLCKIKNDAGEIEIPIELQVFDNPAAPQGSVEFSDVSSTGATLTWLPSTDDGGSPITHYIVEKREENRTMWSPVGKTSDAATTTFHAKGSSGKTYRFRVRAVSKEGESVSIESEPITLKDPFDKPSSVCGDVEMEDTTDTSITISWNKVRSDGGSAVLGYYVEKRKKGTSPWTRCNPDKFCTERKYTAKELRTDVEYEFRVIAVNQAGESDPSRPSSPICACNPVEPPGEPSDLQLIDSTTTSLTFTWKGTDKQGGADLIGYDIELKKDGTEQWVKYHNSHITSTSFTAHGLESNASYHVRIRSVNIRNHSRYYHYNGTFVAQVFNVAPEFKMTSELEAVVRNGFSVNAGGTIRIYVPYHARPRPVICWTKNESELDEFVDVINDDGISQLVIRNARGHHSGTYKLVLKNASGHQSLAVRVSVRDVPSPPRGPLEVIVNEDNITLRWQAPTSDGGNEVLGYIVQKREARGRDWTSVAQNIKQCMYTITGLHKQRSYYLRVLAENSIGASESLQTKDMVYIKEQIEKIQIENIQYGGKELRIPPSFTVPLKPRIVPEGSKVTLSCSVAGKPGPDTRWFRDGEEVTEDPNCFIENVIGLCRMVIAKARKTDEGFYKIVAENELGVASSEANLVVTDD